MTKRYYSKRVGSQPINLENIEFICNEKEYIFKLGNKETSLKKNGFFSLNKNEDKLFLTINEYSKKQRIPGYNLEKVIYSMYGTYRQNIYNIIIGLVKGFEVTLELFGVGFKILSVEGDSIVMNIGFCKNNIWKKNPNLTYETDLKTSLTIKGSDKQLVTQEAARIRSLRKPSAYHGIGIRYKNEKLIRKSVKGKK